MSAALLAMINARKAQMSRVKALRPASGRNRYRILPGWRVAAKAPAHLSDVAGAVSPEFPLGMPSGKEQWLSEFFMNFGQHFLKDAAGKVVAVAVCPEKTYGKPCKICDEVNRGHIHAKNAGDDVTASRLQEAMAGASILLNVLALDTPTPNEVQILAVAPSVIFGKKGVGGLLNLYGDWPGLIKLGGPADSCADMIITKGGAGKEGTTYDVAALPTAVTLTAAHMAAVKDLDQYIVNEDSTQSSQRALSAVSATSGLLPAPSSPALLGAAAAAFAPPAAAVQHFDDVPDFPTAAVASTAPGAAQVIAPAVTTVAPTPAVQATVAPAADQDQSLEDLLKDL